MVVSNLYSHIEEKIVDLVASSESSVEKKTREINNFVFVV